MSDYTDTGMENRATAQSRGKVVVIGLDGATFDLIHPWAAQGHLPTLNKLMMEGAQGSLQSTVPPMTGPAWTSFATGTNPGKHRLYDWIAREPDSYRFAPVTALDCRQPTLYSLLSRLDRRVCVLNVPMTYPPTAVNGLMVSGMPAPSTRATISYPESLYQEIVENVGDYILYPDPGQAYSDSGIDAFLSRLYRATDLRTATLSYLREREDWDFTMVVYNGTDTVSHAMWKFMDQSHPLHDPAKAEKYGHAIRDYYRYVDGHLAGIVDSLDDETTLLIMSDHGFGPFHKFIHVNNWLLQQGLMQVKQRAQSRLKYGLYRRGFAPMNIYDLLMRSGFGRLKQGVVRGQGQSLLKTLFLSFEDVDWSRTKAYSLGNVGQIYVNVAGREPQGCVARGEEYESIRDEIIANLYKLRDPQTGEQVVEIAYRREELYNGEAFDLAPDVVFIPRRLEYFGFGEYEFGSHQIIEPMKRGISGTHRLNGIFLAHGKAIRPGMTTDNAHLVDLAPTILRLMGESPTAGMDGRSLDEIMIPEQLPSIRNGDDGVDQGPQDDLSARGVMSEEEQQLVAERLRSLGYVG